MQKTHSELVRRFWAITIPIIIQNGITNFVSLLDNIMVGSIGTLPMSGVSIVNRLLFVFNLCIFGGTAGAGIFTAQFHGSEDHKGVRHTFRFKLLLCSLLSVAGIAAFWFGGDGLIRLFLQGQGAAADAAQALQFGRSYLNMMLLGLLPFALTNAYASTLRECEQSFVPMVAGIVAVFVNLIGNYILIFGHFGAPAMGVAGAALATVISRFVELAIVVCWTHCNSKKLPFVKGVLGSVYIPKALFVRIILTGTPLLLNEALFSTGEAFLDQIFSTRGLDVVPAVNISSTIYSLLNVVVLAMAHSAGIYIGQMMGAGKSKEEVRAACRKLLKMCICAGVIFCLVLIGVSGIFPQLYNTTETVRALASKMICVLAVYLITIAYINPVYFILRAGGSTWSSFIFDCGFSWCCTIPVALLVNRLTNWDIVWVYIACRATGMIKCLLGFFMIRKDHWIQNLTK